jgi:hypothetical protein
MLDFRLTVDPRAAYTCGHPFEHSRPASDQPPGVGPVPLVLLSFLNAKRDTLCVFPNHVPNVCSISEYC